MKILFESEYGRIEQFGGVIHIIKDGVPLIVLTIQEFQKAAELIETKSSSKVETHISRK